MRGLARLAIVGGVVAGVLAVWAVDNWQRLRAMGELCSERARETVADLERAPPADADLHRGEGVLVIDTHEVVALVVNGRVVGSTLRCGAGARYPATAWAQ